MKSSTVARKEDGRISLVLVGQGTYTAHTILIPHQNLGIQHLIILQNIIHHLLIQMLRLHRKRHLNTPGLLRLEINIRRLPIQSNPDRLQFRLQQRPLLRPLRRIQNHHNQVTRLGRTNHLSPPPLALRSPLNNPRQIQNLNLRTTILKHARYRRQRRERIRRHFTFRFCDFRQKRRFANGWEADESDARVAGFADVEACAAAGGAGAGLEELGAVAGELAFEETEVVFGGFVFLGTGHFGFDLLDFVGYVDHAGGRVGGVEWEKCAIEERLFYGFTKELRVSSCDFFSSLRESAMWKKISRQVLRSKVNVNSFMIVC